MFHLKEGDIAPAFTGKVQGGNEITLSDFRGKKVLLFFYPKDMTPGCTAQACNLSENMDELLGQNVQVIGVSMDSVERHEKFDAKYDLGFPLIADEERKIIEAYGVWGLKKFMGKEYDGIHRTSFLIDEEGQIQAIINKVKTKEHTQQVLDLLK